MTVQWADVTHNVAPMRARPEGGGEQVSQAIMGDAVEVLAGADGYLQVQGSDGYPGWILGRHLRLCDASELFMRWPSADTLYRIDAPFADLISEAGELVTRLVYGTPVRLAAVDERGQRDAMVLTASGATGFVRPLAARLTHPLTHPAARSGQSAARGACSLARSFVGTPYLWGGTTPFGFDCSGLVQRVYSALGVILPRDAYQQAESSRGGPVPEAAPLTEGDLVFFRGARDTRDRGITHVGMMLDDTRMIHAHGKSGVTIQPLRDPDIVSAYAYRGAWRLK